MQLEEVSTSVLEEATFRAIAKLGNAKNADVEMEVGNELELSDEDRAALIPNETMTKLGYRIAWRRTHLREDGRIISAGHGLWRVAELGATPPSAAPPATAGAVSSVVAIPPLIPWQRLTVGELLLAQRQALRELRRRNIIRGNGAVIGDLAEWLVAEAYEGTLAAQAQKAHDIDLADGTRIQVKARVVSAEGGAGQLQLGTIHHHGYDVLVGVLFDDQDVGVREALEIPREVVERVAAKSNGTFTVHMNPAVITRLLAEGATRITERLRAVAEALHDPPGQLAPGFSEEDDLPVETSP